METSIMFRIAPELVDMGKVMLGYTGPMTDKALEKLLEDGIVGLAKIGILGNPRQAKAERGDDFLELFSDEIVKVVRADWNQLS